MTTKVGRGLASFTWLYDSTVPFPQDGNKRVLDYTRSQSREDFVGYVKDLFIEFSTETNPLPFRSLCAIQLKNSFHSKDRVRALYSQQKWRNLPDDVKDIIRQKLMVMACTATVPLTPVHKNVALLMGVIAAVDFPSGIFFGAPTATNFLASIPQAMVLCVLGEVFEYVKSYNWATDDFIAKALDTAVAGLTSSQGPAVSSWLSVIECLIRFANIEQTQVLLGFLLKIDLGRLDPDAMKDFFAVLTAAVDRDIPNNNNNNLLPPEAINGIIDVAKRVVTSAIASLDDDDARGVVQAIMDLFAALAYRGSADLESNVFCAQFISTVYPVYEAVACAAFNLLEKCSGDDDDSEELVVLLNAISASLSDVVRNVVNKYPDISQCINNGINNNNNNNGSCRCVVCNILKPLFAHVVSIANSGPLRACVAIETLRVLAENRIPKFNIALVQETKLDSVLFSVTQEAPNGCLRDLFLRFMAVMDANYYYLSQSSQDQATKLETFFSSFPAWLRDKPAALLVPFCSCVCGITAAFVQLAEAGVAPVPPLVVGFANSTFDVITSTLASLSLPSVAAYRACSELVSALLYDFYSKLSGANTFCASLCKMLINVVAQKPAAIGSVPTEAVIPYFVDIMNEYIANMQTEDALKCVSVYIDLCSAGWFSQSVARGLAAFRTVLSEALAMPALSSVVPQAVHRIVHVLVPYISVNEKVECSSALDVIAAYIKVGTFNSVIAQDVPQLVTLLHTKVLPFAWHLVKPAAINLLGSIVCTDGAISSCTQQTQADTYALLVKNLGVLAHLDVQDKNDDNDIDYVQDTRFTVLDVLVKLFTHLKAAGAAAQPQQNCVQLVCIALDAITYYYNDWEYTTDKSIVLIYKLCEIIFADFGDVLKTVVSTEQGLIQNITDVMKGFDTSNIDIINARADAMTAYAKL